MPTISNEEIYTMFNAVYQKLRNVERAYTFLDKADPMTDAELTVQASSIGFSSIPSDATFAYIQVQDAPIRYKISGGVPTSSSGLTGGIGDTISLQNREEINNFRAIRASSTNAKLFIQYYKDV